ncbi:MAG: hypothetical protein AAGK05_12960, partial [Pseudomonadota bacterium]
MDLKRQSVNFVGEKTDSFDRNKDNSCSTGTSSVIDPPPFSVSNRYDVLSDEGENYKIPEDDEEVYMLHNFERPKSSKSTSTKPVLTEVENFAHFQRVFSFALNESNLGVHKVL